MINNPQIEVLTMLELNRLYDYAFQQYGFKADKPILALFDKESNIIKLGNIKNHKIAINTLVHEYLHFTVHTQLSDFYGQNISHAFDNLVYSNPKKAKQYGIL